MTVFVLFMAGGLVSGLFFYQTARELVISSKLFSLDPPPLPPLTSPFVPNPANAAPSNNDPANTTPNNASTTVQQNKVVWDKKERVNFLLLGVDRRPGEKGPTRTDTMMIVTLDPNSKSVGILSIPRDLWVQIPGYSEDRINTAYFIGDAKKYPGGGPALAKRTIQYNFGVPIHYYITINFVGFRRMVDELGGIDIDVPKDINDYQFPDDDYGYRELHITKGLQHMNGSLALDYARTRHSDSDFNRMRRQQQVIIAVKEQALRANVITKIPGLWQLREDMVETDIPLDKIIALAQFAKDIKSENVRNEVINESMALGITTGSGAQVLWPDRERIREVIDRLFKPPEAVAVQVPVAVTVPAPQPPQPPEKIKKLTDEGARIEVLNGTNNEGLAGRVAEWLKLQGFNVVLAGNAPSRDYDKTVIVESNNRIYTRSQLLQIFGVSNERVRKNTNAKSDIDYRIYIGNDFDLKVLPTSQ